MIYPVPGEHGWTRTDSPDVDPPKFEKHAGRPKKSRSGGPEDGRMAVSRAGMTTTTCSNCECARSKHQTCGKRLGPDLQIRLDILRAKRVARMGLDLFLKAKVTRTLHGAKCNSGRIGHPRPRWRHAKATEDCVMGKRCDQRKL